MRSCEGVVELKTSCRHWQSESQDSALNLDPLDRTRFSRQDIPDLVDLLDLRLLRVSPGQLLIVLLDTPLQLGKEVVQEERGDHRKILKGNSSRPLGGFKWNIQENTVSKQSNCYFEDL